MLPNIEDETQNWPASRLYQASRSALDTADYETALKYLEALEARFPFGRYAQQAQLDIIYAYYKYDEADSALAAADRFIKLYPRHPKVAYAYYMKGLASFNKGMTSLDYLLNLDPTQRDPRAAQEAFQYFATLVAQFPDSEYAEDAARRLVYLHSNLAQHELNVADYYFRRGAYVAAANRAKYIIEKYQRTQAARDALALLVRSYRQLGLEDLAEDALRVLELNAPQHPELAAQRHSKRAVDRLAPALPAEDGAG
jgi:outer membrane protein assembly factor BamD